MENKAKPKKTLNIQEKDTGTKKKNEYSKLIPFNIPNAKQEFFLPEQYKKNIVLINDLETLNDSSFTNNFECLSNKDQQSFGDSISLIHSRQGSKSSLFEDKNKVVNNNKKLQEELIKKEKENILLKKEIIDLKKNINMIKEKESLYQNKFIKLNESYKNIEILLNNIKNEYDSKEKEYLEKIDKLKIDIKNKSNILNSFEEKIIYKNKIIENLNNLIKLKDLKIKEFNSKIRKNEYSKKNIDFHININNSNENKENENYNNIKNIRRSLQNENKKIANLDIFLKKNKLPINKINSKTKKVNSNIEDKSTTNIYKKNKIHHSGIGTYRNQDVSRQIKNYNYIDESKLKIPKRAIKDISLKKQLDITKEMTKIKHGKNKNKNSQNNNSMKDISNLKLDRNYFRQFSNISCYSYINKTNNPEPPKLSKTVKGINSLDKKNHLIKEENSKNVFLKRLYKNNKKLVKTSISDSTTSYNYISDSEINRSNINKFNDSKSKNQKENKSYDFNINEYKKINYNYIYINTKKESGDLSSEKITKNLNQKHRIPNYRKSNIENRNVNYSFLKENHSVNFDKNNIYYKEQYRYKKPLFNYNNSIIDYNLNSLSNRTKFN